MRKVNWYNIDTVASTILVIPQENTGIFDIYRKSIHIPTSFPQAAIAFHHWLLKIQEIF